MLNPRPQGRGFHGRPPDARAEQVQARRLLDEFGRRADPDQGAGALAGDLERDRRGVAARRPRRLRIPAADRALEGVRRRDEQPRVVVRDLDPCGGARRGDAEHRGVRDRARADGASGVRRQGADHDRSRVERPRRAEHRVRLESGRVRHVRARADRGALRTGARVVRDHEPHLHRRRAVRLRRQVLQAQSRVGETAPAAVAAADHARTRRSRRRGASSPPRPPTICSPPSPRSTRAASTSTT